MSNGPHPFFSLGINVEEGKNNENYSKIEMANQIAEFWYVKLNLYITSIKYIIRFSKNFIVIIFLQTYF